MSMLGKIFKKKLDVSELDKLELPELPHLPEFGIGTSSKAKGKNGKSRKTMPAYPGYVSSERHSEDIGKLSETVSNKQKELEDVLKKLEKQVSDIVPLKKDLELFKKMRVVDFEQMRKQMDELKGSSIEKLESDISELNKLWDELETLKNDIKDAKKNPNSKITDEIRADIDDIRAEIKNFAKNDVRAKLAEHEDDLSKLQDEVNELKSRDFSKLKDELAPMIQAMVVQHIFESKYDPKKMKEMKKQVMSFISKAIDSGHEENDVKNALMQKGWPEELIGAYYDSIYNEKMRR